MNHSLINKCPRFEFCSAPQCLLDLEMEERIKLPEDEKCPLLKGKKTKIKVGSRLLEVIKFIPEKNLKWVRKKYLKRSKIKNKL